MTDGDAMAMSRPFEDLIRRHVAILEDIRCGERISLHVRSFIAAIVLGGGAYGAALGAWHDVRLAAYVSVKIPALMLLTALTTALFQWIVASMYGLSLSFRQTVAVSLLPLAVASIMLASMSPIVWFFSCALPEPTASERTLHNLLYLTHTLVVGAAGVVGTRMLRSMLVALCSDFARGRRIYWSWFAAYAFVGGEIAWALRPFVGSVYLPVVFLRPDALHGNVYEFIITDILPHLWRRMTS